jgi:hypothetical protein
MGGKVELVPAAIKKIEIQDYEYEKYASYTGNELTGCFYNVYRISPDSKTITEYSYSYNVSGKATNMVWKLDEFPTYYTMDIDKGTILHVYENWSNNVFNNNQKGNYFNEAVFDYTNLLVVCTMKSWDGYEIKEQHSKISLKNGYSYFWANNTFIFMATRVIDSTKPGIICFIYPQYLKDSAPVTFAFKGTEMVNTEAGNFRTIKAGAYVSDPFLANLLHDAVKDFVFWIDDSPGHKTVKYINPGGASWGQLVETGIWTDR